MVSVSYAGSSQSQVSDPVLLDRIGKALQNETNYGTKVALLNSLTLENGTAFVFSSVRKETNGVSAILMTTLSTYIQDYQLPALFLGSSNVDFACGTVVFMNNQPFYAVAFTDGLVKVFSCEIENSIIAEYSIGDRTVLGIVHQPCLSNSKLLCFFLAYPDSIVQIVCNIFEGNVNQLVPAITLKYDSQEFGTFQCFEVCL
jgi:hypothetical protein